MARDGTTYATVLTRAIFTEGCKSVAAGMNVKGSFFQYLKITETGSWKEQAKLSSNDAGGLPPAAKRLCHHRNAKQPQPCYSGSLELHCSRELSRVETSANEPSNSKSVDFLAFRRNR